MAIHNERCKECKKRILELLTKLFGDVKVNYNLNLSNNPESFIEKSHYKDLKNIFTLLQNHRGHNHFIRTKKLPNVDFFVVNSGFIVEFDESQHFTKSREISLKNYSSNLKVGYNKERWIKLCTTLHKKDNDPPFRDEQRAWYDTLRDFAPFLLSLKPTIRLFAKDYMWCKFNPEDKLDLIKFQKILDDKNERL
ncbi:MAG TPA: hypothetical protein VJB35_00965 [Candidatus Nanoarchaeia archaeon]|nr:hypothetical protein [Candidatus Nanoarchaeia archaeon]